MCLTNLGFSGGSNRDTYQVTSLCARFAPDTYNIGLHPPPKKWQRPAHAQGATHTHSNVRVTTAASETEGVAAVSWIESLMIRRPFGSIDPNSIRETELHKESRRRHTRGERESRHSPQLDRERDADRQRAAATRREQWTVLSGTSTIGHGLHVADRAQGLTGT